MSVSWLQGGNVTNGNTAIDATEEQSDIKFGVLHLSPRQLHMLRVIPMWIVGILIGFAVIWVLFLADRSFTTATSAGSAIEEPGEFIVTLLDGLTFAGLLFVVSSGFTLVFGLMRTGNSSWVTSPMMEKSVLAGSITRSSSGP